MEVQMSAMSSPTQSESSADSMPANPSVEAPAVRAAGGFASCGIGDYDLVLPGQPLVRRAASKFKTVPSATLNGLVDLMKEARQETENQPPPAKSSHRVRCH